MSDDKKFRVMGKYRNMTEEIDSADSLSEAEELASEYRQAFGSLWSIWIYEHPSASLF